jgi:hypothetical protein
VLDPCEVCGELFCWAAQGRCPGCGTPNPPAVTRLAGDRDRLRSALAGVRDLADKAAGEAGDPAALADTLGTIRHVVDTAFVRPPEGW